MPGEISFNWTPHEISPLQLNIPDEQTFDFGFVTENDLQIYTNAPTDKCFVPSINLRFHKFDGYVRAGEPVKYNLKIKGTNFSYSKLFSFEVEWDGKWFSDLNKMNKHFKVTKV